MVIVPRVKACVGSKGEWSAFELSKPEAGEELSLSPCKYIALMLSQEAELQTKGAPILDGGGKAERIDGQCEPMKAP